MESMDGIDFSMDRHMCYALVHTVDRRTYVGYTVNPTRRLMQHNGALSGGAKFTSRSDGRWKFLFIVAYEHQNHQNQNQWTNRTALSLEWHLKRFGRSAPRIPSAKKSHRGRHGRRRWVQQKQSDSVMSTSTSNLQPPVARRIACLVESIFHSKFRKFASNFVIFADESIIEETFFQIMWRSLELGGDGHPCCVLPLDEFFVND